MTTLGVEAGAGDLDFLQGWRTADSAEGYTRLFFSHGAVCAQALIVRAAASGFMLCVPSGVFSEEELSGFQAEGYPGMFGPHFAASVPCLLIDVAAEGIDRLQVDPFPDLELKVFGTQRLQSVWPHRARVLDALAGFLDGSAADPPDRLDAYFTCGSEEELLPLAAPVGAEAIQNDVLQQLLMHATTQAEALASLNTRLQSLETPVAAAPAVSPAPAAAAALEGGGVPQWAPQLFSEGARAQLPEEQLQRLLQLAGKGPQRLGDLAGPSAAPAKPGAAQLYLGAAAKAAPTPHPAGGVGALAEDAEEAGADEDVEAEGSALAKVLSQQTKLLAALVTSATKKASDPLSILGGGGTDEETKVYHKVRERLAQARRKGSTAALEPRDMFYHFQDVVPLGHYKTLTYFAFLLCDAWEAMEQGRSEEVMSLISLGLVFAEQVANEGGATRLGWLLTFRDDPPFSLVEQRRAPRSEVPHGLLADPRWVTANLAYLKDVESIQDRTAKSHQQHLQQQPGSSSTTTTPGPGEPKGGRGGKRGQRGRETPEPTA
ncbi:unnamed protein product [Symbiodinium microadriaticum]|nr:unnamed protein product [Symbiodinium microadriaticum]